MNYKLPSMFIGTCFCDFKCCIEGGFPSSVCQNSKHAESPTVLITDSTIFDRYSSNAITSSVVIGGLEPILQLDEVISLIKEFRARQCYDTFVIYTGYDEDEIPEQIAELKQYDNIIMKFGRYRPNQEPHYDEVLGVKLASANQYARKVC